MGTLLPLIVVALCFLAIDGCTAHQGVLFLVEPCDLSQDGRIDHLRCASMTEDHARVLKPRPLIGRAFLPQEYEKAAPHVAMLSYGLWQRRFGGDAQIIGRTLPLNGKAVTVVGILPKEFENPPNTDIWVPAR